MQLAARARCGQLWDVVAFLFDFNGVLVDDEQVHFEAFRAVVAEHGVALTEDEYTERYLAYDDRTAFHAMLEDHGRPAPHDVVDACVARKLPLYMQAVEHALVLFPGAFELLRACAAVGPVAIVSGALRPEIDFALVRAGTSVPVIVSAEEVTACKPDPAGYLEGLRRLGVSGAEAVCIEDTMAGIRAARGAGCAVAGVGHSYDVRDLRLAGADPVVGQIAGLTVDSLIAAARAPRGR